MKYILLAVAFLAASLMAEETPSYLKNGQILTKLKNGKSYEFSTNEYMVVKRGQKRPPCPSLPPVVHSEKKMNRVRLMGGLGPTGINSQNVPSGVRVTTNQSAVAGLGYDRALDDRFSLNASGYTNGTVTIGFGVDF